METPDERDLIVHPDGRVLFGGAEYRAALGRGGVSRDKHEGDGATPSGCFPVREILYRSDRVQLPKTAVPARPVTEADGWCDDPDDPAYNQRVGLPYAAHHESLWREDHLYDIIVVLGYNDTPPVPGKGSAIFMHIAAPGYTSTDGCVAFAQDDLLAIIPQLRPETRACVAPGTTE